LLEGQVLDGAAVTEQLANMPGKNEAGAMLVATLKAPLQRVVMLLNTPAGNLVRGLQAKEEKGEGRAPFLPKKKSHPRKSVRSTGKWLKSPRSRSSITCPISPSFRLQSWSRSSRPSGACLQRPLRSRAEAAERPPQLLRQSRRRRSSTSS